MNSDPTTTAPDASVVLDEHEDDRGDAKVTDRDEEGVADLRRQCESEDLRDPVQCSARDDLRQAGRRSGAGGRALSDVFAATVGGARLQDPAADLALAVAIASSHLGVAPPRGVVAIGEIGLAGELRRVRDLPQRLAEAARLGFKVAVVPRDRSTGQGRGPTARMLDGLEVIEVDDVAGALLTLRLHRAG